MMDEYIIKYLPSHEDKLRKKVFEGSRYLKKKVGGPVSFKFSVKKKIEFKEHSGATDEESGSREQDMRESNRRLGN